MSGAPRPPAIPARRPRLALGWLCAALAGACEPGTAAMDAAGPQAARIRDLTLWLVGVGSAVYLLVVGFLLYALWRGSRRAQNAAGPEEERRMTRWVVGAVGATTVILVGFLFANFFTGRALAAFAEPGALTVRVIGHQWWWEVEYQDPVPGRRLRTANEIYLPVGRRVRLLTQSRDVIHSFWAPSLHGKIDLIPGYSGTTYLQVDRPGVYLGKCAEFCGLQHARMDFRVVAVPPDSFAAWYMRQLQPAPPPSDSVQLAGQQVFLSRGCAMCHAVRGTPSGSHVGPDLTHLASRTTLAAGTLPNTRGHLAGWVLDPQRIKPGVRMPPNQLSSEELHALLRYLESLR